MKTILALSLLLCSLFAAAQTPRTPNLGLWIPNQGQAQWGGLLNQNFEIIDGALSSFTTGEFGAVQHINFVTGASIFDDSLHPGGAPGGLFLSIANGQTWNWVHQTSGVGDDFNFSQSASFDPTNGQGAAITMFTGASNASSATSRHIGCPGGHILPSGGISIESQSLAGSPVYNFCADMNGVWMQGPVNITWAPFNGGQGVLNLFPTTFSAINGVYPCVSNQGAFAAIADSTTNVNGATISGSGPFPVAAYCNGTNWVVASGILGTVTNCAVVGSGSPSVAACGSAAAGVISCAVAASAGTCTVNTTFVTNNSQILIQQRTDTATGTRIGSITCNTTKDTNSTAPQVSAVVTGTSFSFPLGTISTNPECFNYVIENQ